MQFSVQHRFVYIDSGCTQWNKFAVMSNYYFYNKITKNHSTDSVGHLHGNKCAAACNKVDDVSDLPGFSYILLERIEFNLYLLHWFQI